MGCYRYSDLRQALGKLMKFMFERSFLVKWFAAASVCVAFLGACGGTVVEREDIQPSVPDAPATTSPAGATDTVPTETSPTTTSSASEQIPSTTAPQPVTSTTAAPATTPTTAQPTTTTSPSVTSSTAPTPTFEIETVEPDAPGQELISTVSPSA